MGRLVWLVGVVALLGTFVPGTPATACSCAQSSLDEIVARHPDGIVVLVRRVDDGRRRGAGLGEVIATLHGDAPAVVPLQLDGGASCKPHVAVGHVAALTLQARGGGWETIDCGTVDPTTALGHVSGDLTADPAATGPPGLVLAGGFPGADLVTLDARLRPLATTTVDGWVERLVPCGEDVVVLRGEDLVTVVERRELPDLTVTRSARHSQPDGWRALAVRCTEDGRVEAVARGDHPDAVTWFHRDVLSDEEPNRIPAAEAAAFVGDQVWLLVSDTDARASRIDVLDLTSGTITTRRTFPGLAGYELAASPDGAHVVLRGYAEEQVLLVLDTATATTTGRTLGSSWMPVGTAWLDDGHLLLHDEDAPYGGAAPPFRVVDRGLRIRSEVAGGPGSPLAAADGTIVLGGGAELAVRRPDGSLHASPDLRLTAADTALVVGPVTGPDEEFVPPTAADAGAPDAAPDAMGSPAGWSRAAALVAATLVAAALAAGWRRRRRSRTQTPR